MSLFSAFFTPLRLNWASLLLQAVIPAFASVSFAATTTVTEIAQANSAFATDLYQREQALKALDPGESLKQRAITLLKPLRKWLRCSTSPFLNPRFPPRSRALTNG